jgi:taurine dioxygenase
MWDHIRTIHMAVADYGPEEQRMMLRCQVMADRVFDDAFTPLVSYTSR